MSYDATQLFLGTTNTGYFPEKSYGPMSPVPAGIYDTTPKEYIPQRRVASESFDLDEAVKNGYVYVPQAEQVQNINNQGAIYKPKNSDTKSEITISSVEKPKYTEDQIMMYGRSASYLVQSINDFSNALLAPGNAEFKSRGYDFSASQYERSAKLLEKNISDINRAARMDANVYKLQNKEIKDKQTVAMAASGFAVGKGSYKSTFATSDARTNYNIAMRMLKADLQTAETTRKAGEYRARAEIERGNAKIARTMGKAEMWSGIINGVGNLVNSGFNFYVGEYGLSGAGKTTTFKNLSGGTSTIVHGGYTKVDI